MQPETAPLPRFQAEAFGKYYLVDKVAVGGMAEVFKAKTFSHGGFEKLLVIKRILQHLSDNAEFVDMFIDEAKISVLLQHPNIVQVYDFGKIRDNYFIAMECVEGKDVKALLRKLSDRRKVLPPEYAVYIAHEVCKGLDYAHKKQNLKGEPLCIVHRDMSPSNVLLSYTGDVKIADFGIAKAEISLYNTKDGVLKGKFEYMSPEQASGQPIDHRSDLFSVGILLHEMLTGRRLFKSESEMRTLERVKTVDVRPPSETNPSIPARLDDLVMRALSRDPDARFTDAKELQNALLEFLYPATPDTVRDSVAGFLCEVFGEEIADERERLEEGTRVAVRLSEAEEEIEPDVVWQEGAQGSGGTLRTRASRWPLAVAVLALVVAGGIVAYFARPREPQVIERVVEKEAPLPTHGAIEVRITPAVAATIRLGDTVIGTGPVLVYDKVAPGTDHALSVEMPGYLPFEDVVNLSAGDRLRLPVTLRAEPAPGAPARGPTPRGGGGSTAPASPETTAPAEARGAVSVNVSRGWAEVYIDGTKIETTPLSNHPLSAGLHSIRVINPTSGFEATREVRIQSGKSERVYFQVD